jgi:NAD+ synthase (glutamine-hydrolysing)
MVVEAIAAGDAQVEADARRIGSFADGVAITNAQELASRLFVTVYMGSINSSADTRCRWEATMSAVSPV